MSDSKRFFMPLTWLKGLGSTNSATLCFCCGGAACTGAAWARAATARCLLASWGRARSAMAGGWPGCASDGLAVGWSAQQRDAGAAGADAAMALSGGRCCVQEVMRRRACSGRCALAGFDAQHRALMPSHMPPALLLGFAAGAGPPGLHVLYTPRRPLLTARGPDCLSPPGSAHAAR
jgi:hypothetical protein